jgi:hypothetical protein
MSGEVEIHVICAAHDHPGNDEENAVAVRFRTQTGADERSQRTPLSLGVKSLSGAPPSLRKS